MRSTEKRDPLATGNTTQPLPSRMEEEPSAPPLLPPSYDDVLSSIHEDAGVGGSTRHVSPADNRSSSLPPPQQSSPAASAADPRQDNVGPFGDSKPAAARAVPELTAPLSPSLSGVAQASNESAPLMSLYESHLSAAIHMPRSGSGDPSELSSRDFFASLEYKRSSKGYSSSDPWLNSNSQALLRFITECNERPRVSVEVEGSHTENRIVESSRSENGQTRCETHTHQEKVVDFKFSLELTPYIHDKGSLYTARGPTGEPYDISQLLDDYVKADNFLKEIRVQKKVIWDYDQTRREVADFIKSTGYPHTVSVSFPMEHDRISIKSHNAVARIWRHPVTSFLCFVTCACVVGWPVQYFAAKRWRNKLMSDFVVLASPRDFVERNEDFIRNQVSWSIRPRLFPTISC
ncbi:hypothetical protein GGI04_003017 [Coemansia thaxteri]|nr:hypothetical protein GGI04_003017 [Coemansia thaxteri]KAJ2471205.1 hypothetical protein GGI02_002430 [Coemansia sp. RSA 2322]